MIDCSRAEETHCEKVKKGLPQTVDLSTNPPDSPFGAPVSVRRRQIKKKKHKQTKENQPDITDIEKAFVDQGSEHVREEMY